MSSSRVNVSWNSLCAAAVSHKQVSHRGGRFDLAMDHRNITQKEIRRRLLTPDEAMRLHPDHQVIFVSGQQPIYAAKSRYFSDSELDRRSRLATPCDSNRQCPARSRSEGLGLHVGRRSAPTRAIACETASAQEASAGNLPPNRQSEPNP